jgi:hypothetical protein
MAKVRKHPALRCSKSRTCINFLLPDLIRNPSPQAAPVQSQSGEGRSTMSRDGMRSQQRAFLDLSLYEFYCINISAARGAAFPNIHTNSLNRCGHRGRWRRRCSQPFHAGRRSNW